MFIYRIDNLFVPNNNRIVNMHM